MESEPMPTTEAAILERIIEPEQTALTPEAARYLLSLNFRQGDRQRMEELAAKAQDGVLTGVEQTELEQFRHVAQLLDWIRARARETLGDNAAGGAQAEHRQPAFEIPPGIRRSQEALRRDLPKILENRKLRGQWIAYHGDERIGVARDATTLLRECIHRGFKDDQYYIGWIDPTELIEEEEIEPGGNEVDDEDDRFPTP